MPLLASATSLLSTVAPARLAELAADDATLGAALAAMLVLGATGSVHCYAMCGPLACAGQGGSPQTLRGGLAYHAGRAGSYAISGALVGASGATLQRAVGLPIAPVLPWLLAAALIASALDLGRRLPAVPGLSQLLRAIHRRSAPLSPPTRSLVVGAISALLPCGLLYAALGVAIASGGALRGALLLTAFALGTLPALALAQAQSGLVKLGARRRPLLGALLVQRALPLLAAIVLVYRAVLAATGEGHCH